MPHAPSRALLAALLVALPPVLALSDGTPPTPPGGLRATAASSASITLAWDPSDDPESGVARYEVYRSFVLVGETADTTFRDEGLLPDTEYPYLVFAVNGAGAYSDAASLAARTRPAPGPDCGQVAHALATDPDTDVPRGDDRADLVRVSLREDPDRLHFHLGTYDLDDARGGATGYEVAFRYGGFRWILSGAFDGTAGAGRLDAAPVDGGPAVATLAEVGVARACESLVLSVRIEDAGDPAPGETLREMAFRATAAGATLDAAPDEGFTGYVLGSAGAPPALDPIGDRHVPEGQPLAFDVRASDPDGDPVTYQADGLPEGAAFDDATGRFSWRPTYAQAGAHLVTFRAADGRFSDEETVTIRVEDVDTTPVLAPVGDREVPEGGTLAFRLHASDEDGDALAFEATDLPAGATLDAATGEVAWSAPFEPGHDDRAHAVTFTVRDRTHAVSERVTLTVRDVNRPPVLAPLGALEAREGETLTILLSASDPDGDPLTYAAPILPAGATFDAPNATFRWTPTHDDAGPHEARFVVSDGALSDEETATLQVADANRAPALAPIGARALAEGETLVLVLSASDPDGDPLTYAARDLPAGAAFDPSTATFRWTPSFDQGDATYAPRFDVTDGQATVGETVPIAVSHVDRPPLLDPLADAALFEGETLAVELRARDPDGDAVALALEGALPPGATLQDHGAGRLTLRLAPPSGSAGGYPLLARATAGGLEAADAFTLTVRHRAFPVLAREGPDAFNASPGQTVRLAATLRNDAAVDETFLLSTLAAPGWTVSLPAEALTLPPGGEATLTLDVTVPAGQGGTDVQLRALPRDDPASARSLSWRVDAPVALRLHLDLGGAYPAWDRPTGVLRATHLDGTPARSLPVSVTQTPRGALAGLASSLSGATDANGLWFFDFGRDAGARAPGEHDLLARTTPFPGGQPAETRATYRIG